MSDKEKTCSQALVNPMNPDNYRLDKISEIEQFLKKEVINRECLFRKYKRGLNVLQVVSTMCLGLGMGTTAACFGLLASGIGAPIALPVQGIGIATGVLVVIGKVAERKVCLKSQKHGDIGALAQEKLNIISIKVARAYEDGHITDEEFTNITSEWTHYLSRKKEIQNKAEKAINTELTDSEKKEMLQDALPSMLKGSKSE